MIIRDRKHFQAFAKDKAEQNLTFGEFHSKNEVRSFHNLTFN